jgi:hypothetical protein
VDKAGTVTSAVEVEVAGLASQSSEILFFNCGELLLENPHNLIALQWLVDDVPSGAIWSKRDREERHQICLAHRWAQGVVIGEAHPSDFRYDRVHHIQRMKLAS